MSKYKKEINSIDYTSKRVGLYLRLSDEDRDKLTKDQLSESIKNQEIMLRQYVEEKGWTIVGIYNDEDWSGGDSTRPNFNKMISECEKGNIDIVLCKSQARFARDMELIEKYVHNLFHQWNVRFITLVDRIDNTKKETKKTSQIIGLTDQWMLEDTSNNIRDTLRSKRKNGHFTGSFAPYGYLKDPENKNHLIPDLAVVHIIQRIYRDYAKGYGLNKIAKELSDEHILSPYEYKLQNDCKLKIPVIKNYIEYNYITSTGTYIVKVSIKNNQSEIIKGLTTIDVLTDDILFNNKLDINLYRIKNEKVKVYYSTKKLDDLKIKIDNNKYIYNNLNFDDEDKWNLLKVGDVLPKTTTCIATYTNELDRTNEIYYEFEVSLKENRKHIKYFYNIYTKCKNENIDLNCQPQIRNKHQWSDQSIKKILKDEVYIGNMIQFKTTTVSYKNHTVVRNDDDERIRKDDTHEAIIDKSEWYAVQDRLLNRKKCCKNGVAHLLANKVFCENCNGAFCKCGKNDEKGFAYLCCKDKNTKWSNCDNKKYIKQEEVQNFVLNKINNLLDRFYKKDIQLQLNDNLVDKELFKNQIDSLNKEKLNIEKELQSKDSYFQSLYEDLKKGFLDEKEYMNLKNKYKDDYSKLEDRYNIINKELKVIASKQEKLKDKKTLFNKYKHIDELNSEIVNDFVDKIIIGKYNEETNERKIHIVWNFTI